MRYLLFIIDCIIDYWPSFSFDEWLKIVSLVFMGLGGIFAYVQWHRSIQIRRAEFLHQLLEKIRFDDEIVKIMQIVDYNPNWYDSGFHGSEIERGMDKFLSYADYVCYLRQTKNIYKEEFQIFDYQIRRICDNRSCRYYLWNLYHYSRTRKSRCSFYNLISYGIEHKLLPSDFKTNDKLYALKTLNWW